MDLGSWEKLRPFSFTISIYFFIDAFLVCVYIIIYNYIYTVYTVYIYTPVNVPLPCYQRVVNILVLSRSRHHQPLSASLRASGPPNMAMYEARSLSFKGMGWRGVEKIGIPILYPTNIGYHRIILVLCWESTWISRWIMVKWRICRVKWWNGKGQPHQTTRYTTMWNLQPMNLSGCLVRIWHELVSERLEKT